MTARDNDRFLDIGLQLRLRVRGSYSMRLQTELKDFMHWYVDLWSILPSNHSNPINLCRHTVSWIPCRHPDRAKQYSCPHCQTCSCILRRDRALSLALSINNVPKRYINGPITHPTINPPTINAINPLESEESD